MRSGQNHGRQYRGQRDEVSRSSMRFSRSNSNHQQHGRGVRPAPYFESYTFSDRKLKQLLNDFRVPASHNNRSNTSTRLNITLDAFASQWNSNAMKYCSRLPETHAWRTDFFSLQKSDVAGHTVWCNPLWKNIPDVCRWLKRGPHNIHFNMLLLTPLWPNAEWNFELQRMAVKSVVVHREHGLFVRRDGVAMPPPAYDLKVWLISGQSVGQSCGFYKDGRKSTMEHGSAKRNNTTHGYYLSDSMRSPAPQQAGSTRSADLQERRQRRRMEARRGPKETGFQTTPMCSNVKRGASSAFHSGYLPRKYPIQNGFIFSF